MTSGTVKWFDEKKGFGFIAQDGGGRDVFVHHSVIEGSGFKTLGEGEPVEFECDSSEGDRGPRATRVIRLAPADTAPKPAKTEPQEGSSLGGLLAEAMGRKGNRSQLRGGLE